MARYTEAVCRLCRREGDKLFLKGDRCFSGKCALDRRSSKPGQHTASRRKESEYGTQLRAKQKTKRFYGVLESQFHKTYKRAERMPGKTGENLLQLLELRLDNVVYRMGFANSRAEARQLVNHGHFAVNGKRLDIPSYTCKTGQEITVMANSKEAKCFAEISKKLVPEWLSFDVDQLKGQVVSIPEREQIDLRVEETLIVELYSK